MGKKGVSRGGRGSVVVQTKIAAEEKASSSKLSTPNGAIIDEMEQLLRLLEQHTTVPMKSSECDEVLERMFQSYKQISTKNKVDSKREELLQQEIQDFETRSEEANEEIRQLREGYRQADAKSSKLDKLSQQLTHRIQSIECKANEDVKFEKEDRLKMSYDFSSKIKDISLKLDLLSKKRENIIQENSRLKDVLKSCLEEFDRDIEQQKRVMEQQQRQQAINNTEDTANEPEGDPFEISNPFEVPIVNSMQQEWKSMEGEDDLSKIIHLKGQEDALKTHTLQFMEIFDTFQVRLTDSNQLFRLKQNKVDEITKEIKLLETQNKTLATRYAECSITTKKFQEKVSQAQHEKEKYTKLINKQKALIEKFQQDILAMTTPATAT